MVPQRLCSEALQADRWSLKAKAGGDPTADLDNSDFSIEEEND